MNYFYAFLLGIHPELSLAELRALLPYTQITQQQNMAFVESEQEISHKILTRLGGSIKMIELLWKNDTKAESLQTLLPTGNASKIVFGVSVYPENEINRKKSEGYGRELKYLLKTKNISARFVISREPALSSVVVNKNHLLERGAEIALIENKNDTWVGRTIGIQDFARYGRRDYGRPARDAASGILPPKLAQILINLTGPDTTGTLLDPFCGSGTVLQEAALMGYSRLFGADISNRAIQDTTKNIDWLQHHFPETKKTRVQTHTIDIEHIDTKIPPKSIEKIVFEGYLGPPNPRPNEIQKNLGRFEQLYRTTFQTCEKLLTKKGVICAAIPFWEFGRIKHHVSWQHTIPSSLEVQILNQTTKQPSLFYKRPKQTVGREILLLKKIS